MTDVTFYFVFCFLSFFFLISQIPLACFSDCGEGNEALFSSVRLCVCLGVFPFFQMSYLNTLSG